MSDREKKLLILFASAGFLVINFLLIGFIKDMRAKAERELMAAQRKYDTAQMISASRDEVADQMDWLAEHEPEPAAEQDVQTKLQQLCDKEAKSTGLTISSQKPLPTDATEGRHYHRAKFQFSVTGAEDALYRWFNAINMPDQLRIASKITLKPDPKDDTKIDCTAIVEQWFVPLTEDNAPAEDEAEAADEDAGDSEEAPEETE